ncbi:MAG: NTP transferase domain-containing protein [Actinomycetes bacterium]
MIIGILLAAGGGRRFGGPKAPYVFDGERLVDRGVRLLKESGCQEVIVVLGAWFGEVAGATLVRNEKWESGQASSLLKGLELLPPTADRICILLVDQIGITSTAISKVIDSKEDLVALGSENLFSPPIALARQHLIPLISDLSIALSDPQRGDSGARHYFQSVGGTVLQVEDISLLEDLDEKPNH